MPTKTRQSEPARRVARVGCVSYLNAKPLIEGVDADGDVEVDFGVPAVLLDRLVAGSVDAALCPVVDYFRSPTPLRILPVGGIGCEGPTLTVRLFSRVPIDRVSSIAVDRESHTSVALLQVVLNASYGMSPTLLPLDAGSVEADAVLLIGDKVITNCPPRRACPYQLDLGEAWHRLTALPFVFAVWMTRRGQRCDALAQRLERARLYNAGRIPQLAARYAEPHGWPVELAEDYLGRILRYGIDRRALLAIRRFAEMAAELGLVAADRLSIGFEPVNVSTDLSADSPAA